MNKSECQENAVYRRPVPMPKRPERPEQIGWPSPTPLPAIPSTEDVAKTLKQILDRLDAIEKRLANIEKMMMQRPPV